LVCYIGMSDISPTFQWRMEHLSALDKSRNK
jgi:hypothetical protein